MNDRFIRRLQEAIVVCLSGLALFLFLSLVTYHATDPSWAFATQTPAKNAGGLVGAWLASILLYAFGVVAFLFPLILIPIMVMHIRQSRTQEVSFLSNVWLKGFGLVLTLLALSALANNYLFLQSTMLPAMAGGVLGNMLGQNMMAAFNAIGAFIILLVCLLCGLTLCLGVSWVQASRGMCHAVKKATLSIYQTIKNRDQKTSPAPVSPYRAEAPTAFSVSAQTARVKSSPPVIPAAQIAPKPNKVQPKKVVKKAKVKSLNPTGLSTLIGLDLLNEPAPVQQLSLTPADLDALSRLVEQKLLDFGIEVKVVGVHPGPVITRFELALAAGVKASRISTLASDLARSLSAISVRVVEVIPGKSVVGLELPNPCRETVYLKETLSSEQYQEAKSPLSLVLGKDISGHPVVADLAKMPHLLVAGTTGSGKSVGVNAMLLSILFKATPEQVRMVLVDPKMLELSIYDGIPHLLTPVVTDMKEASMILRWCVREMDRRYRLMSSQGVRNLAGFNDKVNKAIKKGEPIEAPEWDQTDTKDHTLKPLPYIVVVVDEFADMMMVVGKKVEQLIARIAQKARAAGIHLILATQRPSVNVITGLIKANIPTRIAYQVSSRVDSRTILDQQGAQQLLGHGDMLYLAPGSGVPMRIHGAFVADEEVHKVVDEWKQYGEPEYLDISVDGSADGFADEEGGGDGEKDDLYDQAVQMVLETRRASISSIQRRLKIGYNRAARLVETMEGAGLVGPMESNGTREILVPESQK